MFIEEHKYFTVPFPTNTEQILKIFSIYNTNKSGILSNLVFLMWKKIRVYINRTNDFGMVPVQEKSFNERVYYWWQVAKLFQDLRKSSNKKIVTKINTSIQHSIWERHYFIYTSSLAMLSSVRMLPQRHPWARNLIIFKSRISHSHNVSSNPQGLTLQHMYITCPCSYAFDLHTPAIVELFNV